MVDLNKALDLLKFDTRMKDWVVKQGILSAEDLAKNLQTLPDSSSDCEEVTLEDKPDFGD